MLTCDGRGGPLRLLRQVSAWFTDSLGLSADYLGALKQEHVDGRTLFEDDHPLLPLEKVRPNIAPFLLLLLYEWDQSNVGFHRNKTYLNL